MIFRFDCRVTGRPYPEVTWYINGQQVANDLTHKIDPRKRVRQQLPDDHQREPRGRRGRDLCREEQSWRNIVPVQP